MTGAARLDTDLRRRRAGRLRVDLKDETAFPLERPVRSDASASLLREIPSNVVGVALLMQRGNGMSVYAGGNRRARHPARIADDVIETARFLVTLVLCLGTDTQQTGRS